MWPLSWNARVRWSRKGVLCVAMYSVNSHRCKTIWHGIQICLSTGITQIQEWSNFLTNDCTRLHNCRVQMFLTSSLHCFHLLPRPAQCRVLFITNFSSQDFSNIFLDCTVHTILARPDCTVHTILVRPDCPCQDSWVLFWIQTTSRGRCGSCAWSPSCATASCAAARFGS